MNIKPYQCSPLSALIFLLVLSCNSGSKSNVLKQQMNPDGCGQNCYVIHYPEQQMNDEKLQEITEAVDFSFKQFSRYFPDLQQRINLTLASGAASGLPSDSLQQASNCKADACSNWENQFVWLISPTNMLNDLISSNIYPIPELGILLEKNKSTVRIKLLSDSVNAPANSDFHDEDQLLSINDQPVASISEFGNVYPPIPDGSEITFILLRDREGKNDTVSVLIDKKPKHEKNPWNIDNEMDQIILSHEIAHVLFTGYANSKVGNKKNLKKEKKKTGGHYGHPSAPAWFNEAMAILAEDKKTQNKRINKMKQNIESKIALGHFLSMDHPSKKAAGERTNNTEKEEIKDIGSLFKMITSKIEETASESANDIFYPQTCSLILFLIDKEGDKIVREIAEGYFNSMDFEEILKQKSTRLPHNISELERQWVSWVEDQE